MGTEKTTVLAIDIGGTKTAAAAVSGDGKILLREQIPTSLS
ncbi:MAG: ROK family protein, partial [Pseudomonadota bacterium]